MSKKSDLTFAISVEAYDSGAVTITERSYPEERKIFLMKHDIEALKEFLINITRK